jgi:hypothetical protein
MSCASAHLANRRLRKGNPGEETWVVSPRAWGRAAQECAQLAPHSTGLPQPLISSDWHGRLKGVFQAVPVSSMVFLLGLILSFLLQLFVAKWKCLSLRRLPPR